jgi:hypothetical protein
MKVRKDLVYAAQIRKAIIDDYEQRAKEGNEKRDKDKLWHVSDLIFPRKTYYDIMQGRKITDKAIGFWFTGVAYHTELQRILGNKYAEVEAKWESVVAHIDHMEEVLLEIKTSRKWTIPSTPSPHYTRQLGDYCAMTGRKSAKIVVIYPTAGRTYKGEKSSTVDIAAWEVSFSKAELEAIKEDMQQTIKEIEYAVKKKNPDNLPPCPKWLLEDFKGAVAGKYDEDADYASPFNFVNLRVNYEQ